MKKKIINMAKNLVFLLLLIVSACGKVTEKSHETINKDTPVDPNINYTIIDAGVDMELIFGKNYKQWTPTGMDIGISEKLIKKCFDDQKNATINRLLNRNPEDYDMQFVGAINENGEKIIWVNCFCKTHADSFKDWKTKLVMVKDGGNCFFNLKINIDKNSYTDVIVNGNG
jgi:hypothetical protein